MSSLEQQLEREQQARRKLDQKLGKILVARLQQEIAKNKRESQKPRNLKNKANGGREE